jgi:hypothetical protein
MIRFCRLLLPLGAILLPWIVGLPGFLLGLLIAPVLLLLFFHRRFSTRQWIRGAILIALTGFLLSISDIALRAILADSLHPRPHEALVERRHERSALFRYRPNARFVREVSGDLALMAGRPDWAEPRRISFVTDRYGFRNSSSLEGPFEILLLGDSFFQGSGCDQDSILAAHLNRWNRRTFNLGVGGFSPWEEVMTLALEAPRLQLVERPLIVWGIFSGNDLDELEGEYRTIHDPERRDSLIRVAWSQFQSFRKRSPTRLLWQRLRYLLPSANESPVIPIAPDSTSIDARPLLFLRPYLQAATRTETDILRHAHWPAMIAAFDAMRTLAESRAWRVLVVRIPSKEEVHLSLFPSQSDATDGFAVAIERAAGAHGFDFIDLAPRFREVTKNQAKSDPLYWRDDTHWTPAGHRLAAELIHSHLYSDTLIN